MLLNTPTPPDTKYMFALTLLLRTIKCNKEEVEFEFLMINP